MIYYFLVGQDASIQEVVLSLVVTIVVFIVSLSFHEFAHAFAAYKCGDSTAKQAGRMTLNPLKHLDFAGAMCFLFLGVGWAKPVPVNPINFKKYKTGSRIVSMAGIATNFALGLLSAVVYAILLNTVFIPSEEFLYVYLILEYFMLVNSFLVLFNIIPIFPFDGFNFLATFLKPDNRYLKYGVKNGAKIIFGVLICSIIFELFFGIDILDWYLSLLYNFVYMPIALL